MTEKILDLSAIWHQAAFVFPHFHRCGINWDEAYREFLPRVLESKTKREHCLLMAEFANLLGDGHTDVFFRREISDELGYLPFALDYADGGYHAEGERVYAINGRPMEEILREAGRYVYHVGEYVPRLRYILPFLLDSRENTLETEAGIRRFTLQSERPNPEENTATRFSCYGDILCIRFDDLLRPRAEEIRKKLLEEKPRAVILDLRENKGGMTKHGADIAQLFISGRFGGCRKWTRKMTGVGYASSLQVLNMPREQLEAISGGADRDEIEKCRRIAQLADFEEYEDSWGDETVSAAFEGPVVLLTSRKTISAAEDFTAFFRTNRRATIIGTPTCGTSGTPLLKALSCGTLRVCSVGYQLRDGTEFLGKGIVPDIPVEPTMKDIRQGRDPVLETALAVLK